MKPFLKKLIYDQTPRRVDTRSVFIGVFIGIAGMCARFAVTDGHWYLMLGLPLYLAVARVIHITCPPKDPTA